VRNAWSFPLVELQKILLGLAHDAAAYRRILSTSKRLAKRYYWWQMLSSAKLDIQHCQPCQRNGTHRHTPYSLLSTIVSPLIPFHTITIDLVTNLPEELSKDTVMTVTDKFTKVVKFIAGRKDNLVVE
jgi:hypothetical protein